VSLDRHEMAPDTEHRDTQDASVHPIDAREPETSAR
jgi:hypothetical protein